MSLNAACLPAGCVYWGGWDSTYTSACTSVTSLELWAEAGSTLHHTYVVQSSVSQKCPREPLRCLFSNPEPGDDTSMMPFLG